MTIRRIEIAQLARWLEVRFCRAAGPGGQNVNKVSTRASLVFDFRNCPLLSEAEKARVARRCATRLTRDGRLRVAAQRARTQAANRRLAEARLVELLADALAVAKKRRPTRPTAASKRRRLDAKKRRGEIKRGRMSKPLPND